MPQQRNASLAMVRIGGREYPAVNERTCRTCCSDYRDTIERETVAGRTWTAIIRSLPDDAGLTERNLSDHFRNQHLPVAAEATKRLAVRQAQDAGAVTEAAVTHVVDYLNFAQTVVGRVSQRVATGEVEPNVADGLRASELLARYQPDHQLDESTYLLAFVTYHEHAQTVMTPAQFQEFGRLLSTDPTLEALAREWDDGRAGSE